MENHFLDGFFFHCYTFSGCKNTLSLKIITDFEKSGHLLSILYTKSEKILKKKAGKSQKVCWICSIYQGYVRLGQVRLYLNTQPEQTRLG